MPADIGDFRRLLSQVANEFGEHISISEAELVNRWFTAGVFSALGYGTDRDDYRIELRLPGSGRADVVLRAFGHRARAVIEFKRPLTPLEGYVDQVTAYADRLLPDVAVLTNGKDLWLYNRSGPLPLDPLSADPSRYDLRTLTATEGRTLYDRLRKLEVDLSDLNALSTALDDLAARPVPVEAPDSPGGVAFLERFALDSRSVFGRFVLALFDVLPTLQGMSRFTAGSYAFWLRAYARELSSDNVPRTWRSLLGDHTGREDIRRFMFCLESAYAVLARALLAKAMQDAGFPNLNVISAFRRSAENHQSQGRLALSGYFSITSEVLGHAGLQAFPSLFASDIFDWWQDATRLSASHPLAETLAETMLAVFGFDFGALEGDVLGELYQEYFDPETRLALGEFYTPPEVVDFILDQVGYEGEVTDRARLLDPACGSGTFLVAALRRYLGAHQGQDAREVLTHLVGGLHIVGLDVNPFAALLAQVNYAAQLLKLYASALEMGGVAIQNLPVYRTDSLRFEKREAEEEQVSTSAARRPRRQRGAALPGAVGFRLTYSGDMAVIRERLPVKTAVGEFVEVLISVPRADIAQERHLVDNLEDYAVALSTLFDAVEADEDESRLVVRLDRANLPRASELATFMAPALSSIRETIDNLRTQYDDGRFKKTLRDLAVAVVVKNELPYDFVVGNPPYVRVQRLADELKAYWINQYSWTHGNFDIYIPFIERAVTDWLRDGGRLGFICSDRFLVQNYARSMRANVCNEATPELIFDLRDTRVFRGALNYPAIFVFRKGVSSDDDLLAGRVFTDPEDETVLLRDASGVLRAARENNDYRRGDYVDAFPMPQAQLTERGWYLMPGTERRVFSALDAAGSHRLEELTSTHSGGFQGVATGADDVMVLRLIEDQGDRLLLRPKGDGPRVEIEREAVRPWLFGHDVERWYIDWDRWYVLFPYIHVDGEYKLAPSREHAERFPYAGLVPFVEDAWPGFWGYVRRPSVRRTLQARERGRWRQGNQRHLWYGVARPQNLEYFERPKLVVQVSSTHADIAVDPTGYVFQAGGRGGGVYGLALSEGPAQTLSYLCAVLNSRPLDFYLKHVSTVYSGKAYSYSDAFLKDLPLIWPRDCREEEFVANLANLADQLSESKSNLRTTEGNCATFPTPQTDTLPPGIDRYPLQRFAEGRPTARTLSRDDVEWRTQLDGRPAMLAGRTTLVLPTTAHAEMVRAWLDAQPRQAISSDDLMSLRLPVTEEGCRLLLDALRRDKAAVTELQRRIQDGEREVDELVLELYGLADDRDARAVIEDFLGRF